jgi:glycosyltransferase involved in cell wall biosynthesis
MNVLFAPDWRAGVPYQKLLANALTTHGITVDFLSEYRRVLPLWRGINPAQHDILHLHWPEAYYAKMGDRYDALRNLRFAFDLIAATRKLPLVFTAHNLLAHNRGHERLAHFNMAAVARRASAIIAHSEAAAQKVANTFRVNPARISVIPHGDLSVELGAPEPRESARTALGVREEKICLIFGTVEPYKGIEQIVNAWKRHAPEAKLVIVGRPNTKEYGAQIKALCVGNSDIDARLGWLEDGDLRRWLSAADAVIFNYRAIFTSGAACMARSFGLPLLLPARIETVDLGEPDPRVFRFQNDTFIETLHHALSVAPDYSAAAGWRKQTAWETVAAQTAHVYERALNHTL